MAANSSSSRQRVLVAVGLGVGHGQGGGDRPGDVRGVGGHLLEQRHEIAERAPLGMDHDGLGAEYGGDVGLAAFGSDPERLRRQGLGLVDVARDLRPHGPQVGVPPRQHRLVELLRHRLHDPAAAIHLVDVQPTGGGLGTHPPGEHEQHRIADPLGPFEGIGRQLQRPLEPGGVLGRIGGVVEDPHDDGIVTRALGDGERLVGQRPAALHRAPEGQLRAQGASTSARPGLSAASRSRAVSSISTLSASRTPTALTQPRWLARAAATSRRVSPASSALAPASRRVSRYSGTPAWRCAVPSPMARSIPSTGSGVSSWPSRSRAWV